MLHAAAVGGDEPTVLFIKGAGVDSEVQGVGLGIAADGGGVETVWHDGVVPRAGVCAVGVINGAAIDIDR